MQVLNGSPQIAKAIKKLLNNAGERIIAVAYVGDSAINYLPNPERLLIYCSTEIPGTNPYSLRILKMLVWSCLKSKIYTPKSTGQNIVMSLLARPIYQTTDSQLMAIMRLLF